MFLGGGFRTFWEAVLVPTAMRHDLLTNGGKTPDELTDWFLRKEDLNVLLIFSAIFTGLMYGATFLSLIHYLEQATSDKNRSRLNSFTFAVYNISIVFGNIIGAAITNSILN